jgi:arylsulfatase A-like enzyme
MAILVSFVLISLTAICTAARAPGDTRPNLVLYFPDTISASAMGAYGSPIVKTPFFDALANNGTLFEVAYASFPQCSPSRCAVVTGRHVHTLGHRTMTHLLQPYEQNMWQMLKDSGYTTVHLGKNDMLAAATFNLSFSYWMDGQGVNMGGDSYPFGTAGYYSFMSAPGNSFGNDSSANPDYEAVLRALAFISAPDVPEPFAVFIPGIGAHPPYGMPKDYANMYDPEAIKREAPLMPINATEGKPPFYGPDGIRGFRNISTFDEDFSYQVAANYFARVTYADWIFGQLMTGLDASSVAQRTVLAFASDHGDFMGNYGLVEKWSGAGEEN